MKAGNLLGGLKTKSVAQNSGGGKVKAPSMNSESTRSGVAKSHSIGGRTA
jgi:hypothetical protein